MEDKDSINWKRFFLLQLQGTINKKLKFIGYPETVHDARVFGESPLFENLAALCGGLHFRKKLK